MLLSTDHYLKYYQSLRTLMTRSLTNYEKSTLNAISSESMERKWHGVVKLRKNNTLVEQDTDWICYIIYICTIHCTYTANMVISQLTALPTNHLLVAWHLQCHGRLLHSRLRRRTQVRGHLQLH